MLPIVHGEFRAGADPDLRFAPSGVAVGRVRAVASSRKKEGDQWVDDKTLWVNVVCFNEAAENMAESIEKGMLFYVEGRLQTDEWQAKDGTMRTSVEIVADTVAPSLRYATAKVTKTNRRGGSAPQTPSDRMDGMERNQPADAWAGMASGSDEPPF